jgi:hypothetical protein
MLYAFSNFIPKYPSIVLLTHCDEVNKLWHEGLDQLNYHYLQKLFKQGMVIRFPYIKNSNGVCQGCILGKNIEEII